MPASLKRLASEGAYCAPLAHEPLPQSRPGYVPGRRRHAAPGADRTPPSAPPGRAGTRRQPGRDLPARTPARTWPPRSPGRAWSWPVPESRPPSRTQPPSPGPRPGRGGNCPRERLSCHEATTPCPSMATAVNPAAKNIRAIGMCRDWKGSARGGWMRVGMLGDPPGHGPDHQADARLDGRPGQRPADPGTRARRTGGGLTGRDIGDERRQVSIGPRHQRQSRSRVELVLDQPAVHECRPQRLDHQLAVSVRRPKPTTLHRERLVLRSCHHGTSR